MTDDDRYFVSPNFGAQEIGNRDDEPVWMLLIDYAMVGLLLLVLVPMLVLLLPVWLPALLVGWVAVKAWERVTL